MNENKNTIIGMIVGIVIMSAIIGCFWFILPENNIESFPEEEESVNYYNEKEEEEEETMVQYEVFSAVDGTNDDLEDLQNFHNLMKYDGKFWFAEGGVDGTDVTIYVKSVNSLTGSTTTESNFTWNHPGKTDLTVDGVSIALLNNDDIYAVISYRYTSGASEIGFIYSQYSEDGGSSWNQFLIVGSISVTAIDPLKPKRTLEVGGLISYPNVYYFTGDYKFRFRVPLTAYETNPILNSNAIYAGNMYESEYWFLIYTDASEYKICSYDGAGNPTEEETLTGITAPGTFNADIQQYWKTKNIELIIDADHFYIRVNNGSWTPYSDTGTTTNAIIWDYDSSNNYKINYLIWKDSIYKIRETGFPDKIQETAANAYVGWDDWFVNGADTIYQMSLVELAVSKSLVTTEFLTAPKIEIISTVEPFENQFLPIYDENDVIRANVLIKDFKKDKNAQYHYVCESPIKYDLDAKVDYTPSAVDTPDILKYVIDNYCTFLYYGAATINTTPATTYSFTHNKTVKDVFLWACQQEGYYISIRPDGEVYFDQMTASGDTLTFGTDAMDVPSVHERPLKLSYIYIEGGFLNGVRLYSEEYGEPNNGTYRDRFPEIDNQTDLDSMRDKILAQKNQTIKEYITTTYSVKYFDQGTTATLTDSNYSIAADTFYIIGSTWNLLPEDKMCIVKMVSALYISSLRDKTTGNPKIDGAIENVRQDITKGVNNNASDLNHLVNQVNSSSGSGITPNGVVSSGDISLASGKIITSADGNTAHLLGRNQIGISGSALARFGYRGMTVNNYAIAQSSDFITYIKSGAGKVIDFYPGNTSALRLFSTKVEVVSTIPFYNLYAYNNAVTGRDVYIKSDGKLGYLSSNKDSKKEIVDIVQIEHIIDEMRPVMYKYKEGDDKFHFGFIAEEIKEILPDICYYKAIYDENDIFIREDKNCVEGYSDRDLTAILLKGIQNLKQENKELKERVNKIEEYLKELEGWIKTNVE